jgi:hypothetical protein
MQEEHYMIVIYGLKEHLQHKRELLSNIINECMHEALEFPLNKRSHRFILLERENLYYPEGRTDAYTLIEVNLMHGRKKETLKKLIQTLFAKVEAGVGITPIDLEVIIKVQPAYCWGFRGLCGDEAKLNYTVEV